MIASVNPTAIPALTIAGIFFVVVYVVFGVYVWRNRQRFFGPDDRVDGDRKATRYLQVMAICIPLLFITGRVIFELFEIWTQ